MITRREVKLLTSLKQKKFRELHKLFFVEGLRVLEEAVKSTYPCVQLLATETFLQKHAEQLEKPHFKKISTRIIPELDFKSISDTQSPQGIGGVFRIPEQKITKMRSNFILYLDGVSEPGNVGTLIRSALWFGVKAIILSADAIDIYNPKVIRSAAGAFFFAEVIYDDEERSVLNKYKRNGFSVLGADMNGVDYREVAVNDKTLLVLGNEANGISQQVENLLTRKIMIPRQGEGESLNVSVAGSILLSRLVQAPHQTF